MSDTKRENYIHSNLCTDDEHVCARGHARKNIRTMVITISVIMIVIIIVVVIAIAISFIMIVIIIRVTTVIVVISYKLIPHTHAASLREPWIRKSLWCK